MSDKYWQKQKGLSLFIPRLEKKPNRAIKIHRNWC